MDPKSIKYHILPCWTEQMIGSPAATSCSVSGRPYLPSPDCPEAFALIRSWMTTCIAEHDLCRATLSCAVIDETAPPILPTRIIDVGAPDGAVEPRLIETNGQRGYYVALSHCWGPPGRRPLMTTQETFHNHVNGISWNTLPQTFRDAITTTRTIGLRYLWIDSLCIIQDSHQDWLLESKRMGRVYEEARLTLAASHAPDSSHGLFLPRPPVQTAIELPHMPADGDSMFVTHMPEDYETISPESGSLATRAWATQEWLLSRRMVLYTAGCLVWSCKTITQRETGGSSHITARNHRWKVIVEKFSARGLTYITDRLIALEGLRTAMANMRESDVYCFGLWKNSMPDQLLWYCNEPAERALNTLGLPTWTWASTTHGVRFLNIKKAKNVSKSIRFDEQSKLLAIQSRLTKLHGLIFPCPSQNVMGPGSKYKGCYITAFSKFEFEIFDHLPLSLAFTLVVQEEGTVGYAILDEGRLCSVVDVYCLSLMSKRDSRVSSEGKVKWQVDWVLVLRQLQLKQEPVEYERIGVGKILWPYWHQDGEVAQVCIR